MTIVPSKDFDIMDFLIRQENEIRQKLGYRCELEVELGTEWVFMLEKRFDSWSSKYEDGLSSILGMPLRINYKNPHEIKIWANGVN